MPHNGGVPDGWPTNPQRDLAAYDRLPARVRSLLRNAPIDFAAECVLADWQRWRRKGRDLPGVMVRIQGWIKKAAAEERAWVKAELRRHERAIAASKK